jgi:toxin ParE1/3/4
MPIIRRRPRSLVDLAEIWDHIAEHSEKNADGFLDAIDQKVALLAAQPHKGRVRPELARELRSFPVGRYLIFYLALSDGIEVVRVLHASRDVAAELQED